MSPKNKKKLKIVRKKLDNLDNKLIKLIKKRTSLVKEVEMLKEFKKEIVDQQRIKKILSKIRKKSISNNIDPKITNRIWKNMIWSYIEYEKKTDIYHWNAAQWWIFITKYSFSTLRCFNFCRVYSIL